MQGVRDAGKATQELGSKAEKLAQQGQAFESLGRTALGFGAAAALGVGLAISKWAEFDQQMSYVQAATHETAANMDLLREAALDAGARTVFSATEAAGAIEELARAGVKTQDILAGGLDAALDLAAAGGLQVADAAGIAAVALKTFNLRGEDMSHVADLLAAGAGKAMGDVSQLSQALAQGGQVAKQTGLSIEETTAGLAAFAAQGLLGSDAGTSFKSMLQRLTPQSAEAQAKMDELGISAYDAAGNFIGLAAFAGNLKDSLKTLTPEQRNSAMATIFGSDAVRAATVLYDEGEDGIRNWIDAVDDQGYAAETAAMRLDNLKGDWETLTGSIDTALITMGEGADGPMRAFVQGLTNIVDGFNDLPDGAQQTILAVGIAAATIGLAGGSALIAIPKFAALRVSLETLGLSADRADRLMGVLGKTVSVGGGIVLGMAATATAADLVTEALKNMGQSAEVTSNKLATAGSGAEVLSAGLSRGFIGATDDIKDAEKAIAGLGELLDQLASGTQGGASQNALLAVNAIERLDNSLGELSRKNLPLAQQQFRRVTEDAGLNEKQIATLVNQMDSYKSGLTEAATNQGIAADSAEFLQLALGEVPGQMNSIEDATQSAADAYLEQGDAVVQLNDKLTDLLDRINAANGVTVDAITANANWLEALDGLSAQVERNGTSLNEATVAGSANAAAMGDIANKARDAASAQFEQDLATMSADEAAKKWNTTLQAQKQAFIDSAIAAGYNAGEVQALADRIFQMPPQREIDILVNTASAKWNLQDLNNAFNSLPKSLNIPIRTTVIGQGTVLKDNASGNFYDKGKKVTSFASGDFVPGIYPATPGGIHRLAEAGWPEAYITTNPAYRDHSIDVWGEIGRRIGAWQPMPTSSAPSATASSRARQAPVIKIGPVYGTNEEDLAQRIDEKWRHRMAVAGDLEEVGD